MTTTVTTHDHGIGLGLVSRPTVDNVRAHITASHGVDTEVEAHNELHRLGAEVTRLQDELTSVRATSISAVRDLDAFRIEVRDRVIEGKERYDLCDDGTNWFLNALGLDPLTRDYRVTLSYSTEAKDEEDAYEQFRDYVRYNLDQYEVEIEED